MQIKTMQKILIITILAFAILITSTNSFAGITPGQVTGEVDEELDVDLSFLKTLTDAIRLIGSFIAVGALMLIGIKYVMGSIEERANYKKSMMPYIIGCFILFGASNLAPQIEKIFSGVESGTEELGNQILGLIQILGSLVTVGVLMILGIKYMIGSTEERATYKRSMMPYLVGCVLIFAAVNVTKMIANLTEESLQPADYKQEGFEDAMQSIKEIGGDIEALKKAKNDAEMKYNSAQSRYDRATNEGDRKKAEKDMQKWRSYIDTIEQRIRFLDHGGG